MFFPAEIPSCLFLCDKTKVTHVHKIRTRSISAASWARRFNPSEADIEKEILLHKK